MPTGDALPLAPLAARPDGPVPADPGSSEHRMGTSDAGLQPERTHQQEQALNYQLTTANDQLHDANRGLLTTNAALLTTQGQQQQLNDELEARVADRTQALREAVAEAEVKHQQPHDLFDQAPMAITVIRGAIM